MRKTSYLLISVAVLGMGWLFSRDVKEAREINLPTSKMLTAPAPGLIGSINGFAANMVVSPDRQFAAILNDGYGNQNNGGRQSIAILDLTTNQITDFPDDRLGQDAHQSYFIGLAFSLDGKHLYASVGSITDPGGEKEGDTGNGIAVYGFSGGKPTPERFLKIPPQKNAKEKRVARGVRTPSGAAPPYPAGMAVFGTGKGERILVAGNLSDKVLLLDAASGAVLQSIDLSLHPVIPSSFPYGVVVSRDGRRAWCSLWNLSRVAELDLEKGKVVRWIPLLLPSGPIAPGSHPTAMSLSPDENTLYVALSNADRVVAVPTGGVGPLRPLNTDLLEQKAGGSCPVSLALSLNGQYLFVADACLNAVAVFDVRKILKTPILTMPTFPAEGFIPTDWYPSALATVDGDLLIATSKGRGTGPNNGSNQLREGRRYREHPYIPTLLTGSVARINIDQAEAKLDELTKRVERQNRLASDPGEIVFAKGTNPIKHVIYILKENRTYDQVLGDLKVGNGDPSLTMYGEEITPNLHRIALQFGVLDNFYDSGEVSGDGHEWSTAAIASDYNEQTWQIAYRGKERTYDYQGTVADELPLENGEPDVDEPGTGYIWDNLAAHKLSYRNYGEFIDVTWCKPARVGAFSPKEGTPSASFAECPRDVVQKGEPLPPNVGDPHGGPSSWPWPVPLMRKARATKAALRGHFDPSFPDFNAEYPDQLRADEFLNEFAGFVKARAEGKGEQLPSFVLLYLPDDHTHGTSPGKPKPSASVADNDLAVGRVIEAISRSPYWDDTAVFIVEDDAQDGADHVDAHRSTAYVVSKYSPGSSQKPFVHHRFYTTVNLVHTMEVLLGLPPMNQNDAYAPVMSALFTGAGNQPAFKADWRNRDNGRIYQINPPRAPGAEQSEKMDFTRPDAVNVQVLNAILWRAEKGSAPMPAPRHNVIPARSRENSE